MSIISFDADNIIKAGQLGAVISGSGFGATAGTVTLGGYAMAVTSWSDTQIIVDHNALFGLRGSGQALVVTDAGAATHTLNGVTLQAPASRLNTTFSGTLTGNSVIEPGDAVAGDQIEVSILATNVSDGENTVVTVLRDDGTIVISNPVYDQTYRVSVWIGDQTDGSFSPNPSTYDVHIAVPTANNLILTIGENSLGYLAEFKDLAIQMPSLYSVTGTSDGGMKSALINAYDNMADIVLSFTSLVEEDVWFPDETLWPREKIDRVRVSSITEDMLEDLPARARRTLLQAQLSEANGCLGGYPGEDKQRQGMLSDKAGETGHFFRPRKGIDSPLYSNTQKLLRRFMARRTISLGRA